MIKLHPLTVFFLECFNLSNLFVFVLKQLNLKLVCLLYPYYSDAFMFDNIDIESTEDCYGILLQLFISFFPANKGHHHNHQFMLS